MGNYLENPIKEKEGTVNDACSGYKCGASGM